MDVDESERKKSEKRPIKKALRSISTRPNNPIASDAHSMQCALKFVLPDSNYIKAGGQLALSIIRP